MEESFNSFSQCQKEKAKQKRLSLYNKHFALLEAAGMDAQLGNDDIARYEAAAAMKCVPTTDLRLIPHR